MRGAAISSTDSPQLLFCTTILVIKYLSLSCNSTFGSSSASPSYYICLGERPTCLGDFLLCYKFLNIGLHFLLASIRISMSLIVEQSANYDSGSTSFSSSLSNAKIVAISFSVPSSLVGWEDYSTLAFISLEVSSAMNFWSLSSFLIVLSVTFITSAAF